MTMDGCVAVTRTFDYSNNRLVADNRLLVASLVGMLCTDSPRVDCDSTSAVVGDRDVYLRCQVRARPPPVALYWVLDADNATTRITHSAGHYGQDYWTVATVRTPSHCLLLPPPICVQSSLKPVSYTHLTLPTKRIV